MNVLGIFLSFSFLFSSPKARAGQEPIEFSFLTPVGAENIHRPPAGAGITSLLPLPDSKEGHIEDFNSFGPNRKYPDLFTVSDGTILTPFIFVDMRSQSKLRKFVKMQAQNIAHQTVNQEDQLRVLRSYVSEHLLGDVPLWDPVLKTANDSRVSIPRFSEIQTVGALPAGHYPLAVNFEFLTVPFESMIKYGRGFCIHKSLLTSLIMKELGIPHALRFGSTGSTGHNWIQLADGRILDPTWNLLEYPQISERGGGWFKMDRTSLYQYNFFPFAVWNPEYRSED